MRVNISTLDRGIIPVNTYAINLGVSGLGWESNKKELF
jgi:hypothetical protein